MNNKRASKTTWDLFIAKDWWKSVSLLIRHSACSAFRHTGTDFPRRRQTTSPEKGIDKDQKDHKRPQKTTVISESQFLCLSATLLALLIRHPATDFPQQQ